MTATPGSRGLLRRVRRIDSRVTDVAIALVMVAAMSVMGSTYVTDGWQPFDWWAYILTGLICLPLAARRVWPLAVMLVVSAAYVLYVSRGHILGFNLYGPTLAFYTVASTKPFRTTAVAALGFGGLMFFSGWVVPDLPAAAVAVQTVVFPLMIWAIGELTRRLGLRNRQLTDLAERLRREQQRTVEHAVTQERLQIARELHDVVAHHIALISMQAGLAGYVFDTDPPTARAAVGAIGDASRETLDELRRVLVLLRDSDTVATDGAAIDPSPGLAGLRALVDRIRDTGVAADLDIVGDVEQLPSGVQLTVYRVIQEALTNVVKHAGPCRATVVVRRDARGLVVTVANGRGPGSAGKPVGSAGHGLAGMRERARLYGGTVRTVNRPDGGYTVKLILPLSAPPRGR